MAEILKTFDYSIFKFRKNRQINQHHVNVLAKDFSGDENCLEHCPVVVSNNHIIIDGQHRVKAVQKLKYPVYYTIKNFNNESEIKNAIRKANTNVLQWKLKDFIFTNRDENDEYRYLQNMMDKHKKHLTTSAIFYICKVPGKGNLKKNQLLKSGEIKILNKKEVSEFLDVFSRDLDNVSLPVEFKNILVTRSFVGQLMNLYFYPEPRLSYKLFIEKVSKFCSFLRSAGSEESARECIRFICNKKV